MEQDDLRDALLQILDIPKSTPSRSQTITEKTIVLDTVSRQRIERAIGHNVSSPEELATRIERAFSVSIDGVTIPLTPYLLGRLQSRAIRVDFPDFLKLTVTRLLEEYAGLR